MRQVSVADGTTAVELLRLAEEQPDGVIILIRNGAPVAEMRAEDRKKLQNTGNERETAAARRGFGIARGEFQIPNDFFGPMDLEVQEMFGDAL